MFSRSLIASALLLSTITPSVVAWGDWGHETIGYVAQAFVGPKTLAFIAAKLDSEYGGQLGPAAIWADEVKYDSGWTWSKALHFIDANDSPLDGDCSVQDARDCLGDCILTAITNYTTRILDTSLSVTEQDRALKFLTHFIGDIGQPLHCEAYEVGGNDIDETFAGESTELHAVWDTAMPEKTINDNFGGSITTYATSLVTRIKSGDFAADAASWIACTDHTLKQSTGTDLKCPLLWAQDSNTYVCSTVFTGYLASDLSTTYYDTNAPIVDLQLAKSGYRLAAWLNSIFGDPAPGTA